MTSSGSRQPIAIRALRTDDIPTVALWVADMPLWQRYGLTTARARRLLSGGLAADDVLLVADVPAPEGTACGLAWCLPRGAFGRSPYLRLLGVRADFSGRGIGGALLEALEHRLAGAAGELFLLVSDFNVAAQAFYRRHGYTQIGAIADYVLPQVAELIFWKRLSPAPR